MTFKPTLWATVAAGIALVVLIGLGTWQLDRRSWKSQVIETRAQRVTAPAMPFLDVGDVDTAEYRPVHLTGRYRAGDSIKLLSRTRAGKTGFHIVTPLEIEGATRVVLVDRGWVPVDRDQEFAAAPDGLNEIEGFVRRFETPNRFTPDNDPAAGDWLYLDGGQLASALNLDSVAPFYVQLAPDAGSPEAYPQGDVPNVALRNPHLQYAITWYALALVLLVIYVIFHAGRRVGED